LLTRPFCFVQLASAKEQLQRVKLECIELQNSQSSVALDKLRQGLTAAQTDWDEAEQQWGNRQQTFTELQV
jgi:hypothetical protein